jgi:hypothetical protein
VNGTRQMEGMPYEVDIGNIAKEIKCGLPLKPAS